MARWGRISALGAFSLTMLVLGAWVAYELQPEVRALRDAERVCQSWYQLESGARLEAAYAGDQSAIECLIASNRWSALHGDFSMETDYVAAYWVYLGYLKWAHTGEAIPEALEAATYLTRRDIIIETGAVNAAMGGASGGPYDDDDCHILTDFRLELVRLARPDPVTQPCAARWGLDDDAAAEGRPG